MRSRLRARQFSRGSVGFYTLDARSVCSAHTTWVEPALITVWHSLITAQAAVCIDWKINVSTPVHPIHYDLYLNDSGKKSFIKAHYNDVRR